MFGQSAVLLQSLCLANQSSQEKVESTNSLKLSRSLEHQARNKFRLWTQSTKSTGSHKLDHFHGRRCLDIEHLARPLTLYQGFCNTIQKPGQLHSALSWTPTLTNCVIRAADFQTEAQSQICSILLKTSIIWSHKPFNNVSLHGTLAHNMERRHELSVGWPKLSSSINENNV